VVSFPTLFRSSVEQGLGFLELEPVRLGFLAKFADHPLSVFGELIDAAWGGVGTLGCRVLDRLIGSSVIVGGVLCGVFGHVNSSVRRWESSASAELGLRSVRDA